MSKIIPIVEGPGDEAAVPKLLYKLLHEMTRSDIHIGKPRASQGRDNLTKANGLEQWLRYAMLEQDCAAILVLIDAEKDCPKNLAEDLTRRIRLMNLPHPVAVVVANCEYEAWFLASLDTIADANLQAKVGLPTGLNYPGDVEARRDAKAWLSRQFPGSRVYKETLDQPLMTQGIDIALAKSRSRSFRRLCHAIEEIVTAIDSGDAVVTSFLQ